MKALVVKQFGPLDSMTLEEVASPQPGADEALVDIKAASVNFPDLLVIQGKYQVLPPLPLSNLHGDGAEAIRARVQAWLTAAVTAS